MARRRWRSAALLAIVLASVALVVGRAAPSMATARETSHEARAAVADAASLPGPHVGSLLAVRRVAPEGGPKTLLVELATLSAACSLALLGAWRARQRSAFSRSYAFVPAPCGVRAP